MIRTSLEFDLVCHCCAAGIGTVVETSSLNGFLAFGVLLMESLPGHDAEGGRCSLFNTLG